MAIPTDRQADGQGSDRGLVRQLWIISKAFFFGSGIRYKALVFVVILLALALSVGGVQVLMSYVARYFMTAIADKDVPAYRQWLWWYGTTPDPTLFQQPRLLPAARVIEHRQPGPAHQ